MGDTREISSESEKDVNCVTSKRILIKYFSEKLHRYDDFKMSEAHSKVAEIILNCLNFK